LLAQSKAPQSLCDEISFNKDIYRYFEKTNITGLREKRIEHFCVNTGGPCTYTGDTLLEVHQDQKINETDFNTTVGLLVSAIKTRLEG
jgi:hemoglobin